MLMIGSEALKRSIILNKSPNDADFISSKEEAYDFIDRLPSVKNFKHVKPTRWGEVFFVAGNNPIEFEYTELSPTGRKLIDIVGDGIADLDTLYTIKMSHRYLKDSPHFRKTMLDIQTMRKAGAKIPDRLKDWYKARMNQTYDYPHPKLNVGKKDFFTDNVKYVYDHDTIHEAVAIYGEPAYKKFQTKEVWCDKSMFFDLPYIDQLASVIEESMVLALERHQIPNYFIPDPHRSFEIALEKVCTSITSGWWREFAWENFDIARAMFYSITPHYIDKFYIGVSNGTVKLK